MISKNCKYVPNCHDNNVTINLFLLILLMIDDFCEIYSTVPYSNVHIHIIITIISLAELSSLVTQMVRPNRIKIPTPPPPPRVPAPSLTPSLSPCFQTDCFAAVNGSRGERKRQEKQEDSGGRNKNQDRQIQWDLSVNASRHRRF